MQDKAYQVWKTIAPALRPLAWMYGLVMLARNLLYHLGIYKTYYPPVKTISIGNLAAGGTGKTPMTAYLAQVFLSQNYKVAVLSRGYGRRTTGFLQVTDSADTEKYGDEPCQLKTLLPALWVFVCENRSIGAQAIQKLLPDVQILLLDDAYQHLRIGPDINIMLSTYGQPFYNQHVLPAGLLREPRLGAKRADVIVITKTPRGISEQDASVVKSKVRHYNTTAPIFFTTLLYSPIRLLTTVSFTGKVLVLTTVADALPLQTYLATQVQIGYTLALPDHALYTRVLIKKIIDLCKAHMCDRVITTAKDEVKLQPYLEGFAAAGIAVYVQDVCLAFIPAADEARFNTFVAK